MAFTVFTFGDPKVSQAVLLAIPTLTMGLVFGTSASGNYGWCG